MFQFFSNIVKNIEVDVFLKKSPKNRIVKNWKTSHREKHRIVKKSEHRPPLSSAGNDKHEFYGYDTHIEENDKNYQKHTNQDFFSQH